jgi:nucleoside-diphosphate-sugar epimerase
LRYLRRTETGGKYYNVHLRPVPSPAREEDPRLPATLDNFYFPQEDFLASAQRGAKWTYSIVRPEAIIGTTDKPNGMNTALTIAIYFLVCKKLGIPAPMPTNANYWDGFDDVSYAPLIAEFSVFVSTQPKCANEAFNLVNGDYFSWRYMWPRLAAYFGVTVPLDNKPASSADPETPWQTFSNPKPERGTVLLDGASFADWATDEKQTAWDKLCDQKGVPGAKKTWEFGTWRYQDWVFQRTWSATLSINKARKFGWTGHIDSFDCFANTFAEFERLGLIPARH